MGERVLQRLTMPAGALGNNQKECVPRYLHPAPVCWNILASCFTPPSQDWLQLLASTAVETHPHSTRTLFLQIKHLWA